MENPGKMTVRAENTKQVNDRYALGKGEVHSSILCGSTRNPDKTAAFPAPAPSAHDAIAQNEARNAQVDPWRNRGVRSADVLAPLGLAVLVIAALLYIMAARTMHHFDGWKCRPGDVAGTNGRDLCPPHGRPV